MTLNSSSGRSRRSGGFFSGFLARLERFPIALIELGFRIGIAAVFFKSGLTKIAVPEEEGIGFFARWSAMTIPDSTIDLFRDEYQLPILPPELAAFLGTAAELTMPILIAFGLFARLGAGALLGMTLVIQFLVYPGNWTEHLLWASLLAYILTRGPGALSVDRLLFGKRTTL